MDTRTPQRVALHGKRRESLLTCFFAPPARLGADATVLVVIGVPLAFLPGRPAGLGAGLNDCLGELRHELGLPAENPPCRSADVAAVLTQTDTADQHSDVAFAEAGIRAGGAALRAVEARLDACQQRA